MTRQFDAIVVGTGQAGPSLAARLASSGRSVAIIERQKVGGSCVNYGCIPTKALVASARAAWVARNASRWGVSIGDVSVDIAAVKSRMRQISGESNQGVEKWLEGTDGVELIRGHARFTSERTLDVAGQSLQADQIFLNVGARSLRPQLEGIAEVETWNSSDILASEQLPSHLVVIGGSYIGLEFGQIYRRFGSEVTIIERGPRLIGREDEDVSQGVREILEADGIQVHTHSNCIGFANGDNGPVVRARCDTIDGTHTRDGNKADSAATQFQASHVLIATGRQPNTDDLGCEVAGIELNARGYVQVNDQLETTAEGVWAMGDCNGHGAFTHTSYNDYEIVADQLLAEGKRRLSDRRSCYGLYIDPPLGRVGMTEKEARKSGRKVLVGMRPMSQVGRAHERSETHGFMKVLVDADNKEILGAAVLGIGGDEVVQMFLPAIYAKSPYTVISELVAIHPTVSELVPTMLQSLKPLE